MRWFLPFLFAGCSWTPQQHPDKGPPPNVLAGEVVANGVRDPTTTVVFVAPVYNPMPPLGTGTPTTFATVPASAYTSAATGGLLSAPWSVSGVPDGTYLVTSFMDVDGDFQPTITAMAGATCGDIGGAHIADLTTSDFAAVDVQGGELADDLTIVLGQTFDVERPALYPEVWNDTAGAYVPGSPSVSVSAAAAGAYETFKVRTTAVHAAFGPVDHPALTYDLEGPYPVQSDRWDPYTGAQTCETAFLGMVADANDDGVPDENPEYPGTGLLDTWPHFGLTFLGQPVDTNDDGAPDSFVSGLAHGESWASPAFVSSLSVTLTGELPVGVPFLTDQLDVMFIPAAQHAYPSVEADCAGTWAGGICTEVVQDPDQIPRGAWGLTAIEQTGQTWTVPNELPAATSTDEATFDPLTQFTWVWVTD